ncbi:hypothetical protein [Corynebacterium sp. 70RC1]|uniref:hypothetical protein n=3 Tax=Corynebacterium TaxID=1716 RepID=UPI00211BF0E6|nr:hypothetical protein [Corynebacterium sp. 70RC1]MCQ9356862.1 hypothetical protein [Corynebacterium sp. 122RC1]
MAPLEIRHRSVRPISAKHAQASRFLQQSQTGNPSWLLEAPASPLRGLTEGKRREALRRARNSAENRSAHHPRHGAAITHDDALANTMFGMWKDILPNHDPDAEPERRENRNRVRMWKEALEAAFPHEVDPDGQTTYWRVAHLHLLRNRVSHMDSLLNVDVLDVIGDVFSLVGSIDPVLEQWLTGTSTVKKIYAAQIARVGIEGVNPTVVGLMR